MRWTTALILIFLIIFADQTSKWLVEYFLPFYESVNVIPGLAWFRTYNSGVAFSLFSFVDEKILIAITTSIIGFVIWVWIKLNKPKILASIGFAMIIGGAIGNLIDRIRLGYVIDFILFYIGNWSFAVFNIADSFISIGVVLIVIDEFRSLTNKKMLHNQENK